MAHDLDTMYWQGYDLGVHITLQELSDVYGKGIEDTSVWKEFYAEAEPTEG